MVLNKKINQPRIVNEGIYFRHVDEKFITEKKWTKQYIIIIKIELKNNRIAIIGGNGEIGKHLIKYFGKKNILILSSKKKNNFKSFNLKKKN